MTCSCFYKLAVFTNICNYYNNYKLKEITNWQCLQKSVTAITNCQFNCNYKLLVLIISGLNLKYSQASVIEITILHFLQD